VLATVPIGYGDGVRRAADRQRRPARRRRRFPLVGTVSMDNVALDLGPTAAGRARREALLIGAGLPAEEMARRLGTINYEVTCALTGARAARVPPRRGGAVIETLREALAGERAWLVGGALRDRLLGRPTPDLDVVVDGDVRRAARSLGRGAGGASFELSDQFGAWRVGRRDRSWQVDITPCRAAPWRPTSARATSRSTRWPSRWPAASSSIPTAARRTSTTSACAWSAPRRFVADPLRTLRVARLATELGFEIDPDTAAAVRRHAPGLAGTAQERVFTELRRIVVSDARSAGSRSWTSSSWWPPSCPSSRRCSGVEQNPYHHRDVHGHTLEVLQASIDLERDPAAALGDESLAAPVRALLAEPLADELTRGGALRFGALLHDIAKPQTRTELPDGRIGFPATTSRAPRWRAPALARLRASERLRSHVAA
jgi:hypothetical protein